MILGKVEHANRYGAISDGIAKALRIISSEDLSARAIGRYEIDGDNLVMLVQEYDTRKRSEGVWEAHRKYIDLQLVLTGEESMGRADIADLHSRKPYDAALDVELFDGDGDYFRVPAGSFAIFFPNDAHMPCLATEESAKVRKVVFKIAAK
ncbi:MAG: YhcH/YjgK/YiaL family protein [Capsulimonadaceae bacterium]|nr:YhcH/YjgK/YiaL family protein [Capsulimonadaceae bacterium]